MQDQAFQLRRLAMRTGQQAPRDFAADGRLVVISGSRPQCGTTTLALNLALALVQQGKRTILVDADERRPELTRYCSVTPRLSLADVLAGEGTIHEAIARGPGGLQIVPGGRSQQHDAALEATRLIVQLRSLTAHADAIVVDSGCSNGQAATQLYREADFLLAVTAPDAASVMDTYAALKAHFGSDLPANVAPELFVNQVESEIEAEDIFRRIDQSCERFLGWNLAYGGFAIDDVEARQARTQNLPLLLAAPDSLLSLACESVANCWLQRWPTLSAIRRSA